jgi:hypothetical protein
MVKTKIIGNDKCPHLDKDGKQCNILGRYASKPMTSWNNKHNLDKKRQYWQFIHDDGTRHNIGSFKEYNLRKIKGHPFEDYLKDLYELQEWSYSMAHFADRIADMSRYWNMTESEQNELNDGIKYWKYHR